MKDLEKMVECRAQIVVDALGLRKYPGTGYHDNDPLGPVKHPDPIGRRDAKLEDHLIAFKQAFETVLVPPDAERAVSLMKAFYDSHSHLLDEQRLEQETRTLIETAKEYTERQLDSGCFVVRNAQWNDVLAIIGFQGVGVTSTAV